METDSSPQHTSEKSARLRELLNESVRNSPSSTAGVEIPLRSGETQRDVAASAEAVSEAQRAASASASSATSSNSSNSARLNNNQTYFLITPVPPNSKNMAESPRLSLLAPKPSSGTINSARLYEAIRASSGGNSAVPVTFSGDSPRVSYSSSPVASSLVSRFSADARAASTSGASGGNGIARLNELLNEALRCLPSNSPVQSSPNEAWRTSRKLWSHKDTLMLLHYLKESRNFDASRRGSLTDDIAEQLERIYREQGDVAWSAKSIKKKWKNLVDVHRVRKKKQEIAGEQLPPDPYFEIVDEVLKKEVPVPQPVVIETIETIETINQDDLNEMAVSSDPSGVVAGAASLSSRFKRKRRMLDGGIVKRSFTDARLIKVLERNVDIKEKMLQEMMRQTRLMERIAEKL